MNKINEIYLNILKSRFGIALLCVIPFFFMRKNLFNELYLEAFVVFFAAIASGKRFGAKDSVIFSLWFCLLFFLLEAGALGIGLKTSPFGGLTIIFYGLSILFAMAFKIAVWLTAGGLIFYLVNFIAVKLMLWAKTEKLFKPLSNILSSPLKTAVSAFIIVILFNLYAYFTGVPVKIENLPKLENSGFEIKTVLDGGKLLLLNKEYNKLAVYDAANDILSMDAPKLEEMPEGYKNQFHPVIFNRLLNGDILIRRFYEKKDENNKIFFRADAYIYSPAKNEIIFKAELPEEVNFYQTSAVQIDDDRILFAGTDNDKKTYIYSIKEKILKGAAETKEKRRGCESLLLKDGRVLIWGGNDNKSAELYDIEKNEFEKINTGFTQDFSFGQDRLYLQEDGSVIIWTVKLEDKEENGIGTYHGTLSGEGYPVPYIALFNPKDKSFKKIDFNNDKKHRFANYVSISASASGKIIIAGGRLIAKKTFIENFIDKNLFKTKKKFSFRSAGHNEDIYFYDVKTGKMKKSYGAKLDDTSAGVKIFILNDNEAVLVYNSYNSVLVHRHKNRYQKITFN